MFGKKGLSFYQDWVEIFGIIFLIIGFILAVSTGSAVINYFVIFVGGMLAGRVLFLRKNKFKVSFVLIMIMFLLGYMLGTRYGNTAATLTFFVIGAALSYRLHHDGYLK